jgi:hypothetical protein
VVLIDFIPGERAVYIEEVEGGALIHTVYFGAEATKEANAELRADTEGKRFGEYRLLASMPPNEMRQSGLEEALRQGDDRFVSRWMNDGENRGYRTSRGRV